MLHKKKMMAIAYRVHSVPHCSPSLCFKFKLEKFLLARRISRTEIAEEGGEEESAAVSARPWR